MTDPNADQWANAPCRNIDPDLWFLDNVDTGIIQPDMVPGLTIALETCNGCPLRMPCLEMGMDDDNIHWGIWGGVLMGERYQLAGINRYKHQLEAIRRARKIRHLTGVPRP